MVVDKKMKMTVISSKCKHYKEGDAMYSNGPMIDLEKSDAVCMTALSAVYPFVYAVRKGVTKETMGFSELVFQCPDCPDVVQFKIETLD